MANLLAPMVLYDGKRLILLKLPLALIFFIVLFSSIDDGHGSPSFGPKVITGNPNNHLDRENQPISGSDYTDIMTISYYSDGEELRATFWLNGKISERPVSKPSFLILLDADYDQKTGVDGIDYGASIFYDGSQWKKQTLEWSKTESKSFERVIQSSNLSIDKFLTDERTSVSHSLNLDKIGSPEKYELIFLTHDTIETENGSKEVFDYSDWVIIPEPDFRITQTPEVVEIRHGEQKEIQLMVDPSHGTYDAYLEKSDKSEGIDVKMEPRFRVDPFGVVTLVISADESAKLGPRNLRMNAQLTPVVEKVEKDLAKSDILALSANPISSNEVDSNDPFEIGEIVVPFTPHIFFLKIDVKPALSSGEQIKAVLDPWESPVNIFTVAASAASAGILWIWHKHKERTGKEKVKKGAV